MAVDGNYNLVMETPIGQQEGKLTLKADGEMLTGSMENQMGKMDIAGTVKGNDVAWDMEVNTPMGEMKLAVKGVLAGDVISGTVQIGNFGSASFTAKKV